MKRAPKAPVELRRTILDVSLALVAEQGLAALSMREVARRAGVTHGAPYHHFVDRAAIITALAEEGFALLAAMLRQSEQRHVDPRLRFEACGRAYVAFAAKHTAHFRLMFRPELGAGMNPLAAAAAFQVLVDVVTDCHTHGLATDVTEEALAITGWSAAHGLAALCIDGPLAQRDTAAMSRMVAKTMGRLMTR